MYGNDIARGLDVYRYDASAPKSTKKGRWLTPAEARSVLPRASTAGYRLLCLTAP